MERYNKKNLKKLFAFGFTGFLIVLIVCRCFFGFLGNVVCMHFLMDLKMSAIASNYSIIKKSMQKKRKEMKPLTFNVDLRLKAFPQSG